MIHRKSRVDPPKEQRPKSSETTLTGSSARTAYNLRFLMPARCPAEQVLLLSFSRWKGNSVKGRCK